MLAQLQMDRTVSTDAMDLVSLLYGLVAIATLFALVRRGRGFWRGPLAARDEQLAWACAFFLVIPVGVLLHELGHAVATWSVGGEVAQLSWRVYWGFIVPVGEFGALGSWWIALAGNVGGLLFGAGLLGLATVIGRRRPAAGRVLLVAGQLEIVFTLVVYPLLTLDGSFASDWKTIYDFTVTPIASSIAAAAHAGLLGALWMSRRRLLELGWAIAGARLDDLRGSRAAVVRDPADVVARRKLSNLFFDGHRPQWAAEAAAQGLKDCGEDSTLYAILGGALLRRHCFHEALGPLTRAEELSGAAPETRAWVRAHRAIALTATGATADALDAFSTLDEPMASDPAVLAWRERAQAAPAGRARTQP